MKRLLSFVTDVRMRYKLATDLNFRDLGTSILEGDGGAFLRDVMVPWLQELKWERKFCHIGQSPHYTFQ